jgi:phage terminase small subunit
MKLSPKEKAFALAYVELREGKAAAIKAGYSAKTAESKASQLLRIIKVADEIKRLQSKVEEKTLITKERVLNELAIIAFADMKDYVSIGDQGQVQLIPFDDERMPEGASRAVQKVKEKRSMRQSQGDSPDIIIDMQMEYGHHSKVDSLKEISELMGYYPPKELKHSGEIGIVDYATRLEQARQKAIDADRRKAKS